MAWTCKLLAAALSFAGLVHAAERETAPAREGDWLGKDRAAWMDASKGLSAADLKAWYAANGSKNTFVAASIANTRSPRPDDYSTVSERQAYYDWMSFALEVEPTFPKAVSDVRFFHATSTVTSRGLLGYVETPLAKSGAPAVGVDPTVRALATSINKQLFRLNVGTLSNLVFKWKEPRSPLTRDARSAVAALDFDLEMVDMEQAAVETILKDKGVNPAAVSGLNDALLKSAELNPGMKEWVVNADQDPRLCDGEDADLV